MRTCITILGALALAACHHARVHAPGDEWLAAIHFTGNETIKKRFKVSAGETKQIGAGEFHGPGGE